MPKGDRPAKDSDSAPFSREEVLEAAPYSRRRLMSTLAAGGIAAVAGCGGSDGKSQKAPKTGNTDTGTDDSGGGGKKDGGTNIYALQGQEVSIEQAQMNLWNVKTGWAPPWYHNPEPLACIDFGTYLGGLAGGYSFINDEKGAEMAPFNEGFKYHDDRKFHPQDVINQQKYLYEPFLQVANGTYDRSLFHYKNLRLDGTRAIQFDFKQEGNPTLNLYNVLAPEGATGLTDSLKSNPVLHKEFLQRGKDATSAKAKQKLVQELLSYEIPIEKGIKHMGVEPGKVKTITRSMSVIDYREPYASEEFPWGLGNEHNPDAPWYKKEWGKKPKMAGYISLPFIDDMEDVSRNTILNAAIAGKIDTIEDIRDPTIVEQFPPGWRLTPGTPEEADALCFSPAGKFGAKDERSRKLRQAVAYILDPGEYSQVSNVPTPSHKVSGIPYSGVERKWLGSTAQYNMTYTNYGDASSGWTNKKKAFKLLREAGLKRDGNMWVDADSGKPFKVDFVYYSGSAELAGSDHAQNVIEQLQRHGLNVDPNNVSGAQMTTMITSADGRKKWDVAMLASQCSTIPHPYFGFSVDCGLGSRDLTDSTQWGPGDFRNGYAKVKVPMPVGDPDGELTEVNYDKLVRKIPQVTEPEKEKELVRKISWIINQWVPMVVMGTQADPNALNVNKFKPKVPLDHELWGFSYYDMVLVGALDVDPEYEPRVTPVDSTKVDPS